jgi:hypothetical protein
MKVTNETRALAYEILAYWLRFNRHSQGSWVGSDEPPIYTEKVGKQEVNVCGSTMCAAGTAVFLSTTPKKFLKAAQNRFNDDGWWEEKAGGLLGLDQGEAHKLFYSNVTTAKKLMRAVAEGDKDEFDRIVEYDYVKLGL